MSGPRLQLSPIDGFENTSLGTASGGYSSYKGSSFTSDVSYVYPSMSEIYIADTFNGMQKVSTYAWGNSNYSYTRYSCAARYALKTTTPNMYIVVSQYTTNNFIFHYVWVGSGVQETILSAKTLIVELPYDEWLTLTNATTAIPDVARTSSNLYPGQVGLIGMSYHNGTADGHAASGSAYYTRRVDATNNKITCTFEFPATYYSIKLYNASSYWNLTKKNMAGKKYGNGSDSVMLGYTVSSYLVAKVYSPIKGCLCLKSYLNGEIPILNE